MISAREMHRKERSISEQAGRGATCVHDGSRVAGSPGEPASEYLDWKQARNASFRNLKHSTKTISLRLPEALPERIRIEAHKRDRPYQSLIKAWLAEDVAQHRKGARRSSGSPEPGIGERAGRAPGGV